jgi:nucleotide-binding universal stress UspA family protein
MSRILLACHGGASSEGAVRIAKALSVRTGWGIDVVTVLPPPVPTDCGYGPVFVPDAQTEEVLEEELLADVRRQLAHSGLGTLRVKLIVGTPAAAIADAALASGASLIVVGLGPHHFADRALGGETALQLAQIGSTPVLAVPGGATVLPRHIVAAVDYSTTSLGAAGIAASMLREGDTIELVHVAQDVAAEASATHVDPAKRLAEIASTLERPSGVQISTRMLEHDPAPALLDYLQGSRAELVALGSHGYGMWKRLLMGSVASKVLRLAQCAVLVVPARCTMATAEGVAVGAGMNAVGDRLTNVQAVPDR